MIRTENIEALSEHISIINCLYWKYQIKDIKLHIGYTTKIYNNGIMFDFGITSKTLSNTSYNLFMNRAELKRMQCPRWYANDTNITPQMASDIELLLCDFTATPRGSFVVQSKDLNEQSICEIIDYIESSTPLICEVIYHDKNTRCREGDSFYGVSKWDFQKSLEEDIKQNVDLSERKLIDDTNKRIKCANLAYKELRKDIDKNFTIFAAFVKKLNETDLKRVASVTNGTFRLNKNNEQEFAKTKQAIAKIANYNIKTYEFYEQWQGMVSKIYSNCEKLTILKGMSVDEYCEKVLGSYSFNYNFNYGSKRCRQGMLLPSYLLDDFIQTERVINMPRSMYEYITDVLKYVRKYNILPTFYTYKAELDCEYRHLTGDIIEDFKQIVKKHPLMKVDYLKRNRKTLAEKNKKKEDERKDEESKVFNIYDNSTYIDMYLMRDENGFLYLSKDCPKYKQKTKWNKGGNAVLLESNYRKKYDLFEYISFSDEKPTQVRLIDYNHIKSNTLDKY